MLSQVKVVKIYDEDKSGNLNENKEAFKPIYKNQFLPIFGMS